MPSPQSVHKTHPLLKSMTCWYTGKAANNRGIHVHTPWVHQAHHCCYWSRWNHQQPSPVQEHCSPSQEHSPAVLLALQVWGTMVTVHQAAITTFVYMYVCTCTQVCACTIPFKSSFSSCSSETWRDTSNERLFGNEQRCMNNKIGLVHI